MTKKRRWICPVCESGVLAPSRPRMDDVRRYCLVCSKKSGRLVQRTCPALEGTRKKVAARRVEKRKAIAVRVQADPKTRLRKLFQQCKRLKCWAGDVSHATLHLQVKRDTTKPDAWFSPGTAWPSGRITITIGTCWNDARATLLHELAHVAQSRRDGTDGHDDGFRSIYAEAAGELLGAHCNPAEIGGHAKIYLMDRAVAAAFGRADEES